MIGGDTTRSKVGGSEDVVVAAAPIEGGRGEVGGGVSSNSGGEEETTNKNFGGNRWPRQETLALLKIRSDMDQVFRESSLKGPLWEEVSRKLAELGYHRSAKKCKEKFENVYKYHKRTKDGRTGKQDGKTYRFFDQLEAFEHNHQPQPVSIISHNLPPTTVTSSYMITVPSTTTTTTNPINVGCDYTSINTVNPAKTAAIPANPIITLYPPTLTNTTHPPSSLPNMSTNLFSSSTSSSTASDDEFARRSKRKRKWKVFFRRLTKEVIDKQEELQKKFLETIEKREHERLVREEAWRIQEMARINREHEILIQERSTAAAKDASVIAYLQNISGGQQQRPFDMANVNASLGLDKTIIQRQEISPKPPSLPSPPPPPRQQPQPQPQTVVNFDVLQKDNGNGNNVVVTSSSRWPKAEVQALIRLRTNLDLKYQENGPKGPLWEEISAAMRKLGYNRNAKRCKEKWENINKYFKKVKESCKKRPEDSKTCPYFHQLDALYKNKNKMNNGVKPISSLIEPLMVQPEQQWPPPPQEGNHQMQTVIMEEMEKDNVDNSQEDDIEGGNSDEEDDDEEEDDGEGGVYEIVANNNKTVPMATTNE